MLKSRVRRSQTLSPVIKNTNNSIHSRKANLETLPDTALIEFIIHRQRAIKPPLINLKLQPELNSNQENSYTVKAFRTKFNLIKNVN